MIMPMIAIAGAPPKLDGCVAVDKKIPAKSRYEEEEEDLKQVQIKQQQTIQPGRGGRPEAD